MASGFVWINIRSPYYVGLVAHYPTRPLDMEDDSENPKKRNAGVALENRRNPQVLTQDVHEPLYSVDLWKRNMQRRQVKANTPTTETTKNKHEYLLSGIGRCWICYEHGMHKVGLRGSQGGSHNQYYRCAVMLDKRKGKSSKELLGEVLDNEGVQSIENENWRELVDAHTTNLRAKKVEAQVDQLIANFTIPEAWYETIAAYYLSDDGMAEFERES